jgi:hypothetical protein
MSIEEAIGRLKVVDGDEPQPLSGPITVGGKLHLTREQWEACQGDGKKGESSPSTGGRKREDVPRVAPAEAPTAAPPTTRNRHETSATPVASLAIEPRSVDSHDAARPTLHRWRRSQLCSWHTQASSYLQRHTPSSATAPATTRLTGSASTLAPPIT